MIKNTQNKLYVGVTRDPKQRVIFHNTRRGASFTKHIPTYQIVFIEGYETLPAARRREIQIKKWRREKKEDLIERYSLGLPTNL